MQTVAIGGRLVRHLGELRHLRAVTTDSEGHALSLFRAQVQRAPARLALIYPSNLAQGKRGGYQSMRFDEIDALSDRYARGLLQNKIGRGVKTIVMVSYSPELFALLLAMLKVGAIPVVVDPGMGITRMLHCYKEAGATAFIGIPIAHVIRKLRPSFFRSISIWATVGKRWFWGGPTLSSMEIDASETLPLANVADTDLALIAFTTGSTGPAKGVEYSHKRLRETVLQIQRLYGIEEAETGLVTSPLFATVHMMLGCSSVLAPMDPTRPADVDPNAILSAIEEFDVAHMFASPALLHRIGDAAKASPNRLRSMKTVFCGGAAAPKGVLEKLATALPKSARIIIGYGATEAMPMASISLKDKLQAEGETQKEGLGYCIGRPVDSIKAKLIRISDGPHPEWTESLAVSQGDVGEIMVAGHLVSRRYHNNAKENQYAKISEDNITWHRTGDLAWEDDGHRLWFCGRKKQRVITKDETLFTVAVESLFNAHQKVYRSALVGVGPKQAQRAVICIELHQPCDNNEANAIRDELAAMARKHTHSANIDAFLFHPGFPVDIRHNAKINREELGIWAGIQLGTLQPKGPPLGLRIIPIAGWLFLAYGIFFPLSHPLLILCWWIDLFLSTVAHIAQLPLALPAGRRIGHSNLRIVLQTLLFGATYWKYLDPIPTPTLKVTSA